MNQKNQKKIKIPIVGTIDSKTERVYFNWEKRFDKIYNNKQYDIVKDLVLIDFIRELLAEQIKEIIKRVKDFMDDQDPFVLDELIKKL